MTLLKDVLSKVDYVQELRVGGYNVNSVLPFTVQKTHWIDHILAKDN